MYQCTGGKIKSAIRGSFNKGYVCLLCRSANTSSFSGPKRRRFIRIKDASSSQDPDRQLQSTFISDNEKSAQLNPFPNDQLPSSGPSPDPKDQRPRKSNRPRLSKDGSQWLRNLVAEKSSTAGNLNQILAVLSKHKEGHQPWPNRRLSAFQKLEHNVSAASSMAKFEIDSMGRGRLGSSRLLREVLQIQQRTEKREAESVDQYAELRDLPVSPVLHPRLTKIRSHMMAKAPTPRREAMTEFEKQLSMNPFAKMLSSEVRTCITTGMRLPTALLTRFTLKSDPSSGRPWLVPSGFKPQSKEREFLEEMAENSEWDDISPLSLRPLTDLVENVQRSEEKSAAGDFDVRSPDEEVGLPSTIVDSSRRESEKMKQMHHRAGEIAHREAAINVTRTSGYISSTWAGVRYVSDNRHKISRFLPIRWHMELKSAVNDIVVRPHIGDYVKRLLSYRLARQLAWLQIEHGYPIIIRWPGKLELRDNSSEGSTMAATGGRCILGGAFSEKRIAAILWFGRKSGDAQTEPWGEMQHHDTPNETKLTESTKFCMRRSIPLYDIRNLMNEAEFGWLRALSRKKGLVCANEAVAIMEDSITVDVLSFMWQLQQYIFPGKLGKASVTLEDTDLLS